MTRKKNEKMTLQERKVAALESIADSLKSLCKEGIEIYITKNAFPVEVLNQR